MTIIQALRSCTHIFLSENWILWNYTVVSSFWKIKPRLVEWETHGNFYGSVLEVTSNCIENTHMQNIRDVILQRVLAIGQFYLPGFCDFLRKASSLRIFTKFCFLFWHHHNFLNMNIVTLTAFTISCDLRKREKVFCLLGFTKKYTPHCADR